MRLNCKISDNKVKFKYKIVYRLLQLNGSNPMQTNFKNCSLSLLIGVYFRQAVKLASQENADFDDVNVYVAQDCTGSYNVFKYFSRS